MAVCVRCGHLAVDRARFCVNCGWPLFQACPYECGNQNIPVAIDGDGLWQCPTCRRPLSRSLNVRSGRAYRYGDAVEGGSHSAIVDWPNYGGPGGTRVGKLNPGGTGLTLTRSSSISVRSYDPPQECIRTAGRTVAVLRDELHVWDEAANNRPERLNLGLAASHPRSLSAHGWNVYVRGDRGIAHVNLLDSQVRILISEPVDHLVALDSGHLLVASARGLRLFDPLDRTEVSVPIPRTTTVHQLLTTPDGTVAILANGEFGVVSADGGWTPIERGHAREANAKDAWYSHGMLFVPTTIGRAIQVSAFPLQPPFGTGPTAQLPIEHSPVVFQGPRSPILLITSGGGAATQTATEGVFYNPQSLTRQTDVLTWPDRQEIRTVIGLSGRQDAAVVLYKSGTTCHIEVRTADNQTANLPNEVYGGNIQWARLLGTEDGFVFVRHEGADVIFTRYNVTL